MHVVPWMHHQRSANDQRCSSKHAGLFPSLQAHEKNMTAQSLCKGCMQESCVRGGKVLVPVTQASIVYLGSFRVNSRTLQAAHRVVTGEGHCMSDAKVLELWHQTHEEPTPHFPHRQIAASRCGTHTPPELTHARQESQAMPGWHCSCDRRTGLTSNRVLYQQPPQPPY